MSYLIEARNLKKHFTLRGKKVLKAVDNVDIAIAPGETLGLVGESGCGKSTVGRTLVGLYKQTAGEIYYKNENIQHLDKQKNREFIRKTQIIFQDPYSSINSYMTVGDIIAEGIDNFKLFKGKERQERIYELLELVGLNKDHTTRYPHEFSGGQRQRIGIARSLAVEPDFIICDEPISALDVSIQAQIVNLLSDLQKKFKLTYLFISHDLSMVQYISDRVAVMYLGKIVETANCDSLYSDPHHPYTKGLLASIPIPDPEIEFSRSAQVMTGEITSPLNPPPGCRFSTRCPLKKQICEEQAPPNVPISDSHFVACHLYT
ncbi:ABC transporter ATP-binding protein [bacterium]|nr:ABC transporter ATP-binding protein [bacterium]